MNNKKINYVLPWLLLPVFQAQAAICPDANNSFLQQGIAPSPWLVNPFSENPIRGDLNTRFIRANILVAGYGRGVMCTYQNSFGRYSIWWQVSVKTPSPIDNNWRENLGGYECTGLLDACVFYPG
jgi:hypothetical protein